MTMTLFAPAARGSGIAGGPSLGREAPQHPREEGGRRREPAPPEAQEEGARDTEPRPATSARRECARLHRHRRLTSVQPFFATTPRTATDL